MKRTTTAGKSRKSHKSRKTTPVQEPVGGPSSTELTTTTPPVPNKMLSTLDATKLGVDADKKDAKDAPTRSSGVPTEDPKEQWWYRPLDSPARKLAEKIVVMRAAGREDKEIAKKLNTTPQSVRQYVYIARKNGWLDSDDEPVDIEAELALNIDRKIVRNVGAALDGVMTNWQTHEMTLAAAKGRGHFKTHEVTKNDGAGQMSVVAIQVIMPPVGAGDQLPQIAEDQMGGVPAYSSEEVFDGEVSESVGSLTTAEEPLQESVGQEKR